MKISLWVRSLGTNGGTERFVFGFAQWLIKHRQSVDVWTAEQQQVLPQVDVHRVSLRARGRLLKMIALDRAFSQLQPTSMTCSFLRAGKAPFYRAGGGCHQRFMLDKRWTVADWYEKKLDRRVMGDAQKVIVNSALVHRELQHYYGMTADKIQLIRNGVDLQRFQPGKRSVSKGPKLIFVGNNFARKGLKTAILSLQYHKQAQLQVVGGDRRIAAYKRFAARHGLGERVSFLGKQANPEDYLQDADVMLLPTRYDPAANVCLEALACGVPVITSKNNGMAEILPEDWMSIEDPEDPVLFAESTKRALQISDLREHCRAIAECYPADRTFQELFEVLQKREDV